MTELEQIAEAQSAEIDRLRELASSLIAWTQKLDDDAGMMRALQRFNAEGEKIVAAMAAMGPAAPPAPGVVVAIDFRRRVFGQRLAALERDLQGVPQVDLAADNAAGMTICDRLIAAELSAREREFVTSLRQQILARPQTFELSDKQAKWLRDIWRSKGAPLSDSRVSEKAAADAEWMEAILRGPLGNSAVFEEWCAQAHAIRGWSRATFKRRLQGFKKRRPELAGGRFTGDPYTLPVQPTEAMAMVERMTRTGLTPDRLAVMHKIDLIEFGPKGRVAAQDGSDRLSPPAPSGEDLIAQATAHTRLKGEIG